MPFLKNPDSYNTFEMYFNKQWQDTLMLSLHNFLCLVLSNMNILLDKCSQVSLVFFIHIYIQFFIDADYLNFKTLQKPTVLGFEEDKKKIDSLELENALLKRKVEELRDKLCDLY